MPPAPLMNLTLGDRIKFCGRGLVARLKPVATAAAFLV
jgi:hypothetical protein